MSTIWPGDGMNVAFRDIPCEFERIYGYAFPPPMSRELFDGKCHATEHTDFLGADLWPDSRAERHRRRESALALVSQGKGFSDVVTAQMSQWGCSRSSAQRDCRWAHDQLN